MYYEKLFSNLFFNIRNLKKILTFQNKKNKELRNLYEKNRQKVPLKIIASMLNCSLATAHNKINGKTILRDHEFEKLLNFYNNIKI